MAAVDFFLKLDGTNFDSKSNIEIESFSWGASNAGSFGSGSGGGTGKVSINDFHIMKVIDKTSPALFAACCSGTHFKSATLSFYKLGTPRTGAGDMSIKLTDCLVSSVAPAGSRHGDPFPMESLTINFAKVEFEYKPSKTTVDLVQGTVDYIPDTSATP